MSDMKLKCLSPWFGSKRTLAPRIVAELGPHRAYWEPFCGSMAVLLAKPAASMETVNDLHGDLVNLARTVKHRTAGPELYRRLRRVMLDSAIHQDAAAVLRARPDYVASNSADIDRAEAYFIAAWFGRNGLAGTSCYNAGFCVRYTKNGGHAAKRFTSAVDSIPAWRRRMRNVTILHLDAFALMERIEDAPGVVIYCDPPYVAKGAKYVHDFAAEDHARLAEAVGRFTKTRVVVSYYDHPVIRDLYDGWRFVECPTTKAMVNQGKRDQTGGTTAPEILLVNDAPKRAIVSVPSQSESLFAA